MRFKVGDVVRLKIGEERTTSGYRFLEANPSRESTITNIRVDGARILLYFRSSWEGVYEHRFELAHPPVLEDLL